VVLVSVLAAPVIADAGQRRRSDDRDDNRSEERRETTGRAVPRSRNSGPRVEAQRPGYQSPGDSRESQQSYREGPRAYGKARPEYRGHKYDGRHAYNVRPPQRYYYPYYASRGWGARTIIVPRVVYPRFVAVAPYRPYVYRPSIGIGVYYGTGGAYPYGYVPRGYYEPIAGRPYGGLRITDMPRSAQVFADGYYVGIVDDFDGIFQHLNLEAGSHRIEIVEPGLQPLAFDVMIQPGRTITFRMN
jgi:hypothetical protein